MMIDPEGNKVTMLCDDFIFLNSKSIFVEYIDVIKAPYYQLIKVLSRKQKETPTNFVFDFSKLVGLTDEELSTIYYKRGHQNILIDMTRSDIAVNYDRIDSVMENIMSENDWFITAAPPLRFVEVIKKLMWKDSFLTKKVFIYYPYNNAAVREDVNKLFGFSNNIEYVWGNMVDIIKEKVPADSTYVFSDIRNIDILNDIGRLEFSSILVPYEYGYNHAGDTLDSEWVIDIDSYKKDITFKFDSFLASVWGVIKQ